MSLISEALRKAREEEAARDTKLRGTVPSTLLGRRSGRGPRLVLGSVIVVVAAAGGGAVAWWVLAGRAGTSPSPRGVGAPVAPASPAPPSQPAAAPAPAPPTASVLPAGAPPPAMAAEPEAEPGNPAPRPAAPTRAAAGAPRSRPPEAEVPARGALEERAADGTTERVYVVDADLGSVKLHLDYLVYRPGSPFASINDEEVKIGSVIEGYEVEEIGADLVRLRGPRGVVVLRTH